MKTTISNKFHNFSKTINHKGELPSVSALRKAMRSSKPFDCKSPTTARREDGAELYLNNGEIIAVVNF